MKILVIGDLHGQKPNIYYDDFEAIIAPGDFCSDEAGELIFKALRINIKNKNQSIQWFDLIDEDQARRMVIDSLQTGRKTLKFLNTFNVPVYIVPGNWDWTPKEKSKWDFLKNDHFSDLITGLDNIHNVYHKSLSNKSYTFIGHGITPGPEIPQHREDLKNYSKDQIEMLTNKYIKTIEKLRNLFHNASKPVIFISHNVPFNTPLDIIQNKKSPKHGYHFGSLITKNLVNEFQPLLCIGGHMHEHFGLCKLNSTLVFNSGFGSNVNILVKIEGNHVEKITFHGGDPSFYP